MANGEYGKAIFPKQTNTGKGLTREPFLHDSGVLFAEHANKQVNK